MSESENFTGKKVSIGLASLPSGTFEHDVAVSDRYQKFSAELLRLSLAAIGVIGLLITNNAFSSEASGRLSWLVNHSSFGFWLITSLLCFSVSAGLALLHFYFSADSKAYHLKYLRLENSLGDVSQIEAIEKRKDFNTFWELYRHDKSYDGKDADRTIKQAADERDVRNYLMKISGKMLLYSGIALWAGAVTLIFSFVPVIFKI